VNIKKEIKKIELKNEWNKKKDDIENRERIVIKNGGFNENV
jgi:hypothetical protein